MQGGAEADVQAISAAAAAAAAMVRASAGGEWAPPAGTDIVRRVYDRTDVPQLSEYEAVGDDDWGDGYGQDGDSESGADSGAAAVAAPASTAAMRLSAFAAASSGGVSSFAPTRAGGAGAAVDPAHLAQVRASDQTDRWTVEESSEEEDEDDRAARLRAESARQAGRTPVITPLPLDPAHVAAAFAAVAASQGGDDFAEDDGFIRYAAPTGAGAPAGGMPLLPGAAGAGQQQPPGGPAQAGVQLPPRPNAGWGGYSSGGGPQLR